MKRIIFLIILVTFGIACKTKKVVQTDEQLLPPNIELLAKNNFKGDFKILYNSNKEYAAIYEILPEDLKNNAPTLKVMIYNVKENLVQWGRKAENGKLYWEEKYKLKIEYTLGGKNMTLYYNPKSKKVTDMK